MSPQNKQPEDLDPSPEPWLAAVVANMQANQDQVYHNALVNFATASANWTAANIINRDLGRALTPPPIPPQRIVIYAALGRLVKQYTAPVDPSVPLPVLPPPTPVAPGNQFTSGAAANTDMQNSLLETILTNVLAIKTGLKIA